VTTGRQMGLACPIQRRPHEIFQEYNRFCNSSVAV